MGLGAPGLRSGGRWCPALPGRPPVKRAYREGCRAHGPRILRRAPHRHRRIPRPQPTPHPPPETAGVKKPCNCAHGGAARGRALQAQSGRPQGEGTGSGSAGYWARVPIRAGCSGAGGAGDVAANTLRASGSPRHVADLRCARQVSAKGRGGQEEGTRMLRGRPRAGQNRTLAPRGWPPLAGCHFLIRRHLRLLSLQRPATAVWGLQQ